MGKKATARKTLPSHKRVYMTRSRAMQRLQLSLKDFRRLCILKGVYPVEPKKIKKGMTRGKTYYLRDDIRYLGRDPVIWKFWEYKTFLRKMTRANARKDEHKLATLRDNVPTYKMDHIVKDRYPTFIDALKDLDDALCMCFLYGNFSKIKGVPVEIVDLSRRLTLEFMHYVIESRSLRKVFISIKGYYYQAEIMGQTITWIVPHQFVLLSNPEVDMRVMRSFTEFYITLLGFVNHKLFSSINMYYPPRLSLAKEMDKEIITGEDKLHAMYEYVGSLNRSLPRRKEDIPAENKPDEFEEDEEEEEGGEEGKEESKEGEEEKKKKKTISYHQLVKQQNLFKGLKFFLGREVPRESLTFVIRSFGGQVSWDKISFVGATYSEADTTITHQIVDKEVIPNKYMNRYYIQPQWVYDSVNARTLLPVENYFHDVVLPPHLSPFVEMKEGSYVPPSISYQQNNAFGERQGTEENDDEESGEETEEEEPENKVEHHIKELKMKVKAGKVKTDRKRKEEEKAEEKRLAVMMIPKKRKRLYDKIMYGKRRNVRTAEKLKEKREKYEASQGKQTNQNNKSKNKTAMKRKRQH
ncbi:pescadillo-like [Panonychus citri]|uniref:pescadillo-like n=1 Tax=Panonychus citri TaxID=50023 RepID=UPI002307B433|nr:pescadillo-like [Panonychus citri]